MSLWVRVLVITSVLLLVAFGYLAIVYLADPFQLLVLGLCGILWVGLPAAIIGIVIMLIFVNVRKKRRVPLYVVGSLVVLAVLMGAAMPLNRLFQEQAVIDAKAYPARVDPLLSAYRQAHGTYPKTLDQIPSAPPLPRLLRRCGYRSDGRTYWFTFPKPGGLIDVWDYSSETQKWDLST